MLKSRPYILLTLIFLLTAIDSYAASQIKNPSQNEVIEKAKLDAIQKTKNSKYHQHDKKINPDETAAQIYVRHGGPTAVVTTTSVKKLSSQDEIIEKAKLEALKKSQSAKYHQHDKKLNPNETAAQIHKKHHGEENTGS